MAISNYKISLLIPTLNAGSKWLQVLEGLREQTLQPERKMIIDSGSTDETVTLAVSFGFEVITIDQADFNHGAARQSLVDLSLDVDVCVFLTQDAILASPNSIASLAKAFNDPEIALAYGRQLPHENAKALEIHARLYNYPPESSVRTFSDKYEVGFKVFFCSNSYCAYRRRALMDVGGFPNNSIMGEDAITSAKMLLAGNKIAYVADATIFHSHSYTLSEQFKRYFDTRVFHEQNKWLIDEFGKPNGEGLKFVSSELRYVIKNDIKSVFKSLGSLAAKWIGYKTGKFYKILPVSVLKKISMHAFYWRYNKGLSD